MERLICVIFFLPRSFPHSSLPFLCFFYTAKRVDWLVFVFIHYVTVFTIKNCTYTAFRYQNGFEKLHYNPSEVTRGEHVICQIDLTEVKSVQYTVYEIRSTSR